ncbi:hypothetical protein LTR10_007239 [Elasticomyces elasticus]|uniref:Uncharacterized protein n=1 Tax=Elasticomyces elasticus TaxID=574655 RepID=A0AAN7W9N4_9PEZI|nr:hypothetical protein LTR10_007239 [Elasticomyces elasticus]KAK4979056.1 hypothetical protein LTR42_001556 [Elasticomyces elasticus]KAK5704192.1 hypothetical protein LTR97_003205 [Elasticomyces elasticus]KAK5725598.1 hypothetical protein LTR15_003788 [Elasticomyces elasticus]
MAWTNLVPLIILLVVVGGGGYIGYQMYVWSGEMKERAGKHMEKKNIGFTKEGGLRVGVKGIDDETYTGKTQNVLVNVWNNAQPDAKPRSGWSSDKKPSVSGSSSRPSTSRTASSSSRPASASQASTLAPQEPRGSQARGTSPVPGGW